MHLPETTRGFRLLPHIADLTIEAWAPTREACIAEAVAGLVSACGTIHPGAPTQETPVEFVPEASDEELLVSVLDDVIYHADVEGVLPASLELHRTNDGGLDGVADMVGLDALSEVGATPKAVTRHGLVCAESDGRWRALVTIDV